MFVDVNGDGALDVPSIGFINPLLVQGASARRLTAGSSLLYVRVVDRSGGLSQYGAVVCATEAATAVSLGCRAVDGGGGGGQTVYDVPFGLAPSVSSFGHVRTPQIGCGVW